MTKTLKIILILFFVFICGCSNKNRPENNIDLTGKWKSRSAEKIGESVFVVREFRFMEKFWLIDYSLYLDNKMQKPVFHFQGEGSYEIEGPSEKVNGAFNGIFKISKKYITLLTDNADTIRDFGFDIYKLKKGQKVDISETGFSFITPVDESELEYDIVKMQGDKLFFGKRPVDNDIGTPEKRPTELGLPLTKY